MGRGGHARVSPPPSAADAEGEGSARVSARAPDTLARPVACRLAVLRCGGAGDGRWDGKETEAVEQQCRDAMPCTQRRPIGSEVALRLQDQMYHYLNTATPAAGGAGST
jgi:hypothetical protein